MNYHQLIMNIKDNANIYRYIEDDEDERLIGFRDARHIAAETALEADEEIKQLKLEVSKLSQELDGVLKAIGVIENTPEGPTMIDRIPDEDWLGDEMIDANICAGKGKLGRI